MSSPPKVREMDVPTVGQSSAQRNLDKIWDLLHDEHTGVIYIYGMGGIGKTTLMKAINNKLQATSEFDYVIWVTVSKELNLERVQEEMMDRLQLNFSEHDSYSKRSMQLRRYLTDKRYMLILDDLWNSINLSEIGIPPNKENRSRTVITTRIANMSVVQVFSDMNVEKIRVEILTEDEAWDLFAGNVGKEVVHQPHIKDVAKDVVMECGGLPLTIVVVAKAMEGENNEELWQDALRALRASAPEIEGMEPEEIAASLLSLMASLNSCRLYKFWIYLTLPSHHVESDVTLGEVGKLKRLTILKITIQDFDCVEDDVFLKQFPKLKRFKVVIGDPFKDNFNMNCMKEVHIRGGNNYPRGVKVMVTHTECLKVFDTDVKDVSQLVGVANGLRMLAIGLCMEIECILDWSDVGENALQNIEKLHLLDLSSLQKLFKGEVPQSCLRKLHEIHLDNCDNLKSLFSSEMVQNLDQLQSLHVMNCIGLEAIIEGHDNSLPENPFPQLRNFTLKKLSQLKSIIDRDTLALPSLIKLEIGECRNLRLPKRPDTTDWPSINMLGNAMWQANPQQHMQRFR
ncbi:hypothetical protein MRB53_021305 [Persea americana]|uniref:Uncharacterized protein n=1 Tax=Persea americana TaxID=3435 RepID=A0ACC2L3Z7_PERAE|nr:hypothetical protein MRB53_021305 [Persea americana]